MPPMWEVTGVARSSERSGRGAGLTLRSRRGFGPTGTTTPASGHEKTEADAMVDFGEVEARGLEPLTYALPARRSPS